MTGHPNLTDEQALRIYGLGLATGLLSLHARDHVPTTAAMHEVATTMAELMDDPAIREEALNVIRPDHEGTP